mmetsp:Transcript_27216/g.59879  ORF Transcript_27216/g.59879 Transcript_27216/m.59879 type:complete len:254 (-) Transcript_27216:248-1009(-)
MVLSIQERLTHNGKTLGYAVIGLLFPNLWKFVAVRNAQKYPIWPKKYNLPWPYGTQGQWISPEETTRSLRDSLKGMQAYAKKRHAHIIGESTLAEKGTLFNRARNFLFGKGGLSKIVGRMDDYLEGGPAGYKAFARSPIGRSLHKNVRTLRFIKGHHAFGVRRGPPFPIDERPDPDTVLNPGAYKLPEPILTRMARRRSAKWHGKISSKYRSLKNKFSGFVATDDCCQSSCSQWIAAPPDSRIHRALQLHDFL